MTDARIYSLYSGSTGNSFLIRTQQSAILIDAGKSCKQLTAALSACGVKPEDIDAIFITHEHTDHIGALPVFLKKHRIPVHVLEKSADPLRANPSVAPCLCLHRPLFCESIGDIRISSFPTPHDSRGSVGYRIEIPTKGGEPLCIGYATDIGYVTRDIEEALLGCQAVILESNHDLEMLHTGPYPYSLKQRIASRYGHLSNPDSAALAARLCQNGTRCLMLAHLSQENNEPQLAYNEVLMAIADPSVNLRTAAPDDEKAVY